MASCANRFEVKHCASNGDVIVASTKLPVGAIASMVKVCGQRTAWGATLGGQVHQGTLKIILAIN